MQLKYVVAALDSVYDPKWADSWDSVGTIVGDPEATVHKVLLALDPVPEVVAEAIEWGADLIVTHHPLFLTPVSSLSTSDPKGRMVHQLIKHDIALHNAHTNADVAANGVAESLAKTLGLTDIRVLAPSPGELFDKWVVFVPHADRERVADAMYSAGAGEIGNYDHVSFHTEGVGTFRPLGGANPVIGSIGEVEQVAEARLELVAPRYLRGELARAIRTAHPYEEPAFDLLEIAVIDAERGHGRVGRLAKPITLREFAGQVSTALPKHNGATRVHGDLDATIETVAVIGGSGGSMLGQVNADVLVTSDLKHHQVLDNFGGCAIIDVPHWASESVWLPTLAKMLPEGLEIKISGIVTDPWNLTIVS